MFRRLLTLCAVCGLLLGAGVLPAAAVPLPWSASLIISNSTTRDFIGVSGDRIVWMDTAENPYPIMTWAGGDPVIVGHSAWRNTEGPVISGDRIAWTRGGDPSGVMTWRVGDAEQTDVASYYSDPPRDFPVDLRMDGDRLTWARGEQAGEISTWKAGDTTPTLLPRPAGITSAWPFACKPEVFGDRVVWYEITAGTNTQIATWRSGDTSSTFVTNDAYQRKDAVLAGDHYVYLGPSDDFTTWLVYTKTLADSGSTVLGSHSGLDTERPVASGDRAAWVAEAPGLGKQVYTWVEGDAAPSIISTGTSSASSLSISGDRLVWIDANSVMTWREGDAAPTRVRTCEGPTRTAVSGDRIVWRNGGTDIWTAVQDATAPVTTSDRVAYYTDSATISLTATDGAGGSTVLATYYVLDGAPQASGTTVTATTAGLHTLAYWSIDRASNREATRTVTFTIVATPSSKGTPSTPGPIATLKHGKAFTAFGYLVKHTAGTSPVTLQFYRYEHGHWKLRKSTTAKASTVLGFSKYSDSTSVPYSGKWRVRARHKVGTKYLYSGYRSFTAS
jgi:hypothetical protein